MTFFIMEPSLRDEGGHHFEFASTIAANSGSNPDDVVIFAHKNCTLSYANGAKIIPWFSDHIHQDVKSQIAYNFSNFLHFNRSLYRDLSGLISDYRFGSGDIVLFPTISENQLWAIVRWAERFKTNDSPVVICYLMFSPDLFAERGEGSMVVNERTFFYKLSLRKILSTGSPVVAFAGGRQLAREYSALMQSEIKPHPVPISISATKEHVMAAKRPNVLLHAGTAKEDKGFLLLPELVERLTKEHPGDHFLMHADFRSEATTPPEMTQAYARLRDVCEMRDNFTLTVGALKRDGYLSLIAQADCYICTYDPRVYARKTSGVVWEAISLGLPILGPSNTFIQREALEWRAGFMPYSVWSADSISEAYSLFRRELNRLAVLSLAAKKQFIAANDGASLTAHFEECANTARGLPFQGKMTTPLLLAWLSFRIRRKLKR